VHLVTFPLSLVANAPYTGRRLLSLTPRKPIPAVARPLGLSYTASIS
jgi:hypothetical protein